MIYWFLYRTLSAPLLSFDLTCLLTWPCGALTTSGSWPCAHALASDLPHQGSHQAPTHGTTQSVRELMLGEGTFAHQEAEASG